MLVALEATALLSAFDGLWQLAIIPGGGFLLWRALGRRHATEPIEGSGERIPAAGEGPSPR